MDTEQKKQDLSFLIEEKQKQKAEYIEYIEWYDSVDKRNMEANQLKYEKYLELGEKYKEGKEKLAFIDKILENSNEKIAELESKRSFFGSLFNTEENQKLEERKSIQMSFDLKVVEGLTEALLNNQKLWKEQIELKKQMNVSFEEIEKYENFNREEIEKNIVSLSKEIEELEKEKQNL